MSIVNLTPDNEGPDDQLCAGRWYQFHESDDVLSYEWVVVSSPAAVSNDDVEFTAPLGKVTFIRVPIEGQYCFAVNKGTQ